MHGMYIKENNQEDTTTAYQANITPHAFDFPNSSNKHQTKQKIKLWQLRTLLFFFSCEARCTSETFVMDASACRVISGCSVWNIGVIRHVRFRIFFQKKK